MPIINPGTGGGSPGPQGPQGIQGFPGFGFDGESGEDGLSILGSQGPAGASGTIGRDGSQGIPGEDGLDGLDSFVPGIQGIQGVQGVRGADGEDGLSSDDFWPGFNPFIDDPLEQISRIQDRNLTVLPNYSAIVVGPYTINLGKTLTIGVGGRFEVLGGAPNTKATVFASQTSTFLNSVINGIEAMAGLGATNSNQIVTPKTSGTLLVAIAGSVTQTSGISNAIDIRLYYGVGTPPAQGSVPIGGVRVGNLAEVGTGSANIPFGFTIVGIVRNLLVNTAYWFDVSLAINNAGATNTNLANANFIAVEL